jgi:hypothetical protein
LRPQPGTEGALSDKIRLPKAFQRGLANLGKICVWFVTSVGVGSAVCGGVCDTVVIKKLKLGKDISILGIYFLGLKNFQKMV